MHVRENDTCTGRSYSCTDCSSPWRIIEKATVDCYNKSEAVTGFFTMIEDHMEVPFATVVLGADVKVTGVELTEREEIVAVCVRGRQRQRIPVCDLPLPSPPPSGAEWIEAYRHWAAGG